MIALVEGRWQQIAFLEERMEGLENQCRKNSRNSSKLPSSDGFKPRKKSLRSKSERHSSGQTGHPGSKPLWSSQLERVELHRVEAWDAPQVQDLAPIQLTVTEHQAEVECCPHCQMLDRGEIPKDVNSVVQYEENLKGLMVYLLDYQLLQSARVEELFADVLGCEISEPTMLQPE